MRLEFTVEPYVEGDTPHYVEAAVEVVSASGHSIDVGPFGSTTDLDEASAPDIVAAALRAAFGAGASRVSLQVTRVG